MEDRQRDGKKYTLLKIRVKKRDGRKCQFPNCSSTAKLNVHHISRWADNISMRYSMTNCITLCSECHKKVTGMEAVYAPMFRTIVLQNMMKIKRGNRGGKIGGNPRH